jgi:RNA polymerase sigma-70 factor, ECF subfamily
VRFRNAARLKSAPDQLSHLDYEDLRAALARLVPNQREALILVTAEGLSYEDAAAVCGIAVGTIRSRVKCARLRLIKLLQLDQPDDVGPDSMTKAALQE